VRCRDRTDRPGPVSSLWAFTDDAWFVNFSRCGDHAAGSNHVQGDFRRQVLQRERILARPAVVVVAEAPCHCRQTRNVIGATRVVQIGTTDHEVFESMSSG